MKQPIVVIAGPTASGKSALAQAVAREFGGVIINADSMQVYRELRVLTARPTAAEEAALSHRLYGVLPASEACSAARWRVLALAAIAEAEAAGRLPILVGGTGLYLKALLEGLAPVPAVPAALRARLRELHADVGAEGLHRRLERLDPVMAARTRPSDPQRLIRALEVVESSGRSLANWQQAGAALPEAKGGPFAGPFATVVLEPPRAALYARCDRRFEAMLAEGALAEVKVLLALNLDPSLPAMKAVGVAELALHLRGEVTLDVAAAAARAATRRYAKRQITWFRHQLTRNLVLSEEPFKQESERLLRKTFSFIREFLLTKTIPGV